MILFDVWASLYPTSVQIFGYYTKSLCQLLDLVYHNSYQIIIAFSWPLSCFSKLKSPLVNCCSPNLVDYAQRTFLTTSTILWPILYTVVQKSKFSAWSKSPKKIILYLFGQILGNGLAKNFSAFSTTIKHDHKFVFFHLYDKNLLKIKLNVIFTWIINKIS